MQPKSQPYQGFEKKDASDFDPFGNQHNWQGYPFQMMMPMDQMQPYFQDQFGESLSDESAYQDQMDNNSGGFHSAQSHSSRSSGGSQVPEERYQHGQRNSEPIPISGYDHSYFNPQSHPMHTFGAVTVGLSDRRTGSMYNGPAPISSNTGSSSRSMYSGSFAHPYSMNPGYSKNPFNMNQKTKQGIKYQQNPHLQSVDALGLDEDTDVRMRNNTQFTVSKPKEDIGGLVLVNDESSADKETTLGTAAKSEDTADCMSEKELSEIFSVNNHEAATLFPALSKQKSNLEIEKVLSAYKHELYEGFRVLPDLKPPAGQTDKAPQQKEPTAAQKKKETPAAQETGLFGFGWAKKKGS